MKLYFNKEEVGSNKIEEIEWTPKIMPHTASESVRLVAVDKHGNRIPDGNLLKFLPNGSIYLYKTVNPALGLNTDSEGRLVISQE
jgi:hypothetical protein